MRTQSLGRVSASIKPDKLDAISGELNPTYVSPDNVTMLAILMQPAYAGRYFPAGNHIVSTVDTATGKTIYHQISLTHGIGVRRNYTGKIVCDVYGNAVIGSGSYGEVRNIIGTIKHRIQNQRELVFEDSDNRRVVKILQPRQNDKEGLEKFQRALVREETMLKAASYTRTRDALIGETQSGDPIYAISMAKFPGQDLFNLLDDDDARCHLERAESPQSVIDAYMVVNGRTAFPALTFDDRFQISIALLKQLSLQIHKNGLIHRDLKPQNIMIAKVNGVWKVNIIDLNLSRLAAQDDRAQVGSAAFIPKEILNFVLDEKSDLFAMGLVITMLWRHSDQWDLTRYSSAKMVFEMRAKENWDTYLNVFECLQGLPINTKFDLLYLFNQILADRKFRPSVEECIAQFEEIYAEYRLSLLPEDRQQDTIEGSNVAKQVNQTVSQSACERLTSSAVHKLCDDLINIIDTVIDEPSVVFAFVEAVNVECFKGLDMKDQLQAKVKGINENFVSAYQQTEKLLAQLRLIYANIGQHGSLSDDLRQRVILLSEQVHEVALFAERIAKTPLALDTIVVETQHLQKKNGKIERAMVYFDALQPNCEQLAPAVGLSV